MEMVSITAIQASRVYVVEGRRRICYTGVWCSSSTTRNIVINSSHVKIYIVFYCMYFSHFNALLFL